MPEAVLAFCPYCDTEQWVPKVCFKTKEGPICVNPKCGKVMLVSDLFVKKEGTEQLLSAYTLPLLESIPYEGPEHWEYHLALPVCDYLWRRNRYFIKATGEHGDWMFPRIQEGDLLLCEFAPHDYMPVARDKIYIFCSLNKFRITRLEIREDDSADKIILVSEIEGRKNLESPFGKDHFIHGTVIASIRIFEVV